MTVLDSVASFGGRASYDCEPLSFGAVLEVTGIGSSASSERTFHGCESLSVVTVPDSVTNIRQGLL